MNKERICICLIFVLLIFMFIVIYVVKENKQDIPNDIDENYLIMNRINELLDNSYKYYQLKEGLIKVDNTLVEINGESYYLVNESWLKSILDLEELINNTFTNIRFVSLYNEIIQKHEMLMLDNQLYIKFLGESCELKYTIDKTKITYEEKSDDIILLNLGLMSISVYKENGKWKMDSNPYACDKNTLLGM